MKNIKKIIKEEIGDFDWVSSHMDTVQNEPHHIALAEVFGVKSIEGMSEEPTGGHYGLPIYQNSEGEEFVVGTIGEADTSLYGYYESYIDDVGVSESGIDYEDFIHVDRHYASDIANSMADSRVDDMDDEYLGELSDYEEEFLTISERMDELIDEGEGDSDEYSELDERRDEIIDESREEQREYIRDEEISNIEEDPIGYLVDDLSYYMDAKQMLDDGVISVDEHDLINSLVNDGEYEVLSHYDGNYDFVTVDGEDYICFRY